jgi:hypothetical protein
MEIRDSRFDPSGGNMEIPIETGKETAEPGRTWNLK